ncbi:hypothetical protein QQ045_022164 [Rhodiola kirilowii]
MAALYAKVDASNEWTTGLCGCCEDSSNCCITCCCPCITFGQNAEILERGATSCPASGAIFFALSYVGWAFLYSCSYRSKLRKAYSLPAEPCADVLVHCFCSPCAICQEYRELKNRGVDPKAGWAANSNGMMAPEVGGMARY